MPRKSNEITAITELLKVLELEGCIVTIDLRLSAVENHLIEDSIAKQQDIPCRYILIEVLLRPTNGFPPENASSTSVRGLYLHWKITCRTIDGQLTDS